MKPAPFRYLAPESVAEALHALAEHGWDSKLLAGGQSLVPVLSFRLARPAVLIDLNRIGELAFLHASENGLRIGAMCRQRRLERAPEVARLAPLLAEAAPWIAHPQIRNRGTVGGSLAHADPAAELPAVAVSLGARFRLLSTTSDRWVRAEDFYLGLFATALEPTEMLAEIEIPAPPPRTGDAFLEVARRHGDYAQVGLAVRVSLTEAGRCHEARLTFLSVGDVPMRADKAGRMLAGEQLTPELLAAAAQVAAEEEIDPTDDIHATADYKRHLAAVLTRRALEQATRRAQAAWVEEEKG